MSAHKVLINCNNTARTHLAKKFSITKAFCNFLAVLGMFPFLNTVTPCANGKSNRIYKLNFQYDTH